MSSNASGQPESNRALSEVEADFERVRRITIDSAEGWLIENDAAVTRDAHYDATFLFLTNCFHPEVRVTFSRGHRLFEAVLRWRISSQFQIVQGPVVREWSAERAAVVGEEDDDG